MGLTMEDRPLGIYLTNRRRKATTIPSATATATLLWRRRTLLRRELRHMMRMTVGRGSNLPSWINAATRCTYQQVLSQVLLGNWARRRVTGTEASTTGRITGRTTGPITGPITGRTTGRTTGRITGPITGRITGPIIAGGARPRKRPNWPSTSHSTGRTSLR